MASPLKMNRRDDSIASLSERGPETFTQSVVTRNDSFIQEEETEETVKLGHSM